MSGASKDRQENSPDQAVANFEKEASDLYERIAELEAENKSLRGARLAALNLMEDAIEARERLQRSEARFSALVNQSTAGICRADLSGELTFVNARLCAMLGYEENQLLGRSLWDLAYHGFSDEDKRRLQESETGNGGVFQTEKRLIRKDGTLLWTTCSLSAIVGPHGQAAAMSAVIVDISERKQAEDTIALNFRDTQALQSLSARLITEESIQTVYDEILQAAITLTSANAGTIQMLDEASNELEILATSGFDPDFVKRFSRVGPAATTSCGLALRSGKRSFVDFDVPADQDKDGSLRRHVEAGFYSAQSTPLIKRSGQIIGMVSTHWREREHRLDDREAGLVDLLARQAADIVEQRRSAQEIIDINERLRVATEAAELGTWEWDLENDRVIWNDHHYVMLGLEPRPGPVDVEEFFSRVHPDDLEDLRAQVRRSLTDGTAFNAVYRIFTANGTVRWMSGYGKPISRGEGVTRMMSGVMLDVTYRMEIEEELRKSNDRMRLLIESAKDYSIFTTDAEGVVNSWNSGSERIFGYKEDEIVGQSAAILFTEEDRENGTHIREMQVAKETGRSLDERWHQRKDGSTFFASGVVHPLGDSNNPGFVKIARDMTDRLVQEEAAREKELLETLVAAQETERRRIARDLHDELGQQLTALRLKLENLTSAVAESHASDLEDVKEIAKRIDDGVDFLAWELRPAPLEELGLVGALEKYADEWSRYADVSSNVAGSNVHGHPFDPNTETAIYRIVQESLNNIHKHAEAKNVEITLRRRDGTLVLIVEDDGKGFDPDDADTKSRGIGLVGMKERAELIGGSLEIESTRGKGTTLYIKTPIN